jgi:hypothetical protein
VLDKEEEGTSSFSGAALSAQGPSTVSRIMLSSSRKAPRWNVRPPWRMVTGAVKLLAQMSRRSLGGSVMWNQRTFHGGPIKFYFSIANNKNQGLFRRRDITF